MQYNVSRHQYRRLKVHGIKFRLIKGIIPPEHENSTVGHLFIDEYIISSNDPNIESALEEVQKEFYVTCDGRKKCHFCGNHTHNCVC